MWSADAIIGRTVYLDANVFIYAFESTLALSDSLLPLKAVFQHFQQNRAWARTSSITRAEVLVHPLRQNNLDLANLYRSLLSGVGLIGMDAVSLSVIDSAASLRAQYGLRLADALHIASAIESGCDAVLTADKRMAACRPSIDFLLLDELL
ncbi:MAG TPA: PIN domain-containing protein [Rhodocyclaceae bacterium]|nr:PIN domain-containing protein [Rhodocyclaceae bacterium]